MHAQLQEMGAPLDRSHGVIARNACLLLCAAVGCLAFLGLGGSDALGAEESRLLAEVNGEPLTTMDLDALLASQPRPNRSDAPSVLEPEGLLQRLIQNRLVEQEGYRTEVDKNPVVRNQVWDLKRHKGMMALLDSVSSEARRYDDSALVEALHKENTILKVSQILLEDEASARAMMDSLRAGRPFADLADRHSVESSPAIAAGGDLGWNRSDLFVPEFAAALENLAPGEYSEPFETERGWHILQLTDKRTETAGQSDAMEEAVRKAATRDRVMKAVRDFVASLYEKYDARIDSTLLASLDYGSTDPEVKALLQQNDGVLVELPWRTLTVRDLSQEIRFQHFHGIEGKPNAAQLRDKVFDEWTTELLLRHEAGVLGFDRTPSLLFEAEALERRLVREAVLGKVLEAKFAPTADEIEAYYRAHQDRFMPEARVRANGILIGDESAGRTVLDMVGEGARMSWLASNLTEVIDPNPEILSGWVEPSVLGVTGDVERGSYIGPTPVGDAWVVAEILEVEPVEPLPLAECRTEVLQAMRGEAMRSSLEKAMEQLEAGAEIEIMEGAEELVAARIEAWLGYPIEMP